MSEPGPRLHGQPLQLFRGAPNLSATGFPIFVAPTGGVSVITCIALSANVTPPEGAALDVYLTPDSRPVLQVALQSAIGVTTTAGVINCNLTLDHDTGVELVVVGTVVLNQWCLVSGLWYPGVTAFPE